MVKKKILTTRGTQDENQIPLPANETKEVKELKYPLPKLDCTLYLSQVAGNGSTTGSTLWISSQILICYLQNNQQKQKYDLRRKSDEVNRKKNVIELGAGIGLTSLVLERLGWNVISTDIEPPLCTVLKPNIERNGKGNIKVQRLDWTNFHIDELDQHHSIDLIITADTIYQPTLVNGLFQTIKTILRKSLDCIETDDDKEISSSKRERNKPHALIALERRDDQQIQNALNCAKENHQLQLKRISQREIRKCVDNCFNLDDDESNQNQKSIWSRDVWEDVEIWRVDLIE